MAGERDGTRAALGDLLVGQTVVVYTRWVLVVSALVVALWNPGPIHELRVQVMAIVLLVGANFYLHAQLLVARPGIARELVYASSGADLVVIAAIVVSQGGFSSQNYSFLYRQFSRWRCRSPFRSASATPWPPPRGMPPSLRYQRERRRMPCPRFFIRVLAVVAVGGVRRAVPQHRTGTRNRIRAGRRAARLIRSREVEMNHVQILAREAAENLFFGQQVIIVAR